MYLALLPSYVFRIRMTAIFECVVIDALHFVYSQIEKKTSVFYFQDTIFPFKYISLAHQASRTAALAIWVKKY